MNDHTDRFHRGAEADARRILARLISKAAITATDMPSRTWYWLNGVSSKRSIKNTALRTEG